MCTAAVVPLGVVDVGEDGVCILLKDRGGGCLRQEFAGGVPEAGFDAVQVDGHTGDLPAVAHIYRTCLL